MNRLTKKTTVGVILSAGGAALLLGIGIANADSSPTKSTSPAYENTFQMYANVDAEGDLGSNYDASGATRVVPSWPNGYQVTFTHPIGSCAAVVQAGKAGGTDPVRFLQSLVVPSPSSPNAFIVDFDGGTGAGVVKEPFMLTVTCRS